MPGVFVTGTDTGIGKTLITCALANIFSKKYRVGVMKPFASGSHSDVQNLRRAARRSDLSLDDINPVFFSRPLAPFSATHFDRKKIDFSRIFKAYQKIQSVSDFALVEGMGGLHVPITKRYTVADLALQMKLPILIVTRLGLGTLNHTLLTVNYARQKGLSILGIIINSTKNEKDLSTQTNVQALSSLLPFPVLGPIPYLKGSFLKKLKVLSSGDYFSKHRLEQLFS